MAGALKKVNFAIQNDKTNLRNCHNAKSKQIIFVNILGDWTDWIEGQQQSSLHSDSDLWKDPSSTRENATRIGL